MKERIIKQITYFSRLIITEKRNIISDLSKISPNDLQIKKKANKQTNK